MKVILSYSGVSQVDNLLREIPKVITHRILGAAHVAAARPLINAAYFGVQIKSGRLADSIGAVKLPLRSTKELGAVVVGPIRKKGTKFGYHGHLIEYGHRMVSHRTSKKIKFLPKKQLYERKDKKQTKLVNGRVRPFPFMRPAFEKTKFIVKANIEREIVNKLLSVMRRTIRKSGQQWSNG